MSRSRRCRPAAALSAFLLAAGTVCVVAPGSVQAASFTMQVVSPVEGRIGIDALYQGGGGGGEYDVKTCSYANEPTLGWNASGQLVGTTSVPDAISGLGRLTRVRFEMYPGPCGHYDPWGSNVGGVHVEVPATTSNLGEIRMPVVGPWAFRIDGAISSSTAVPDGRVEVDTFQIPTAYPDPPMPLQQNGRAAYGAFATSSSRGDRWTGGVGWAGRYLLFIRDKGPDNALNTADDRHAHGWADIGPDRIPTLDLDAWCFGLETCVYQRGAPPTPAGTFHPLPPTRILDTRIGIGIGNGPLRSGDGRHPSLDPITRRDEAANHTLQVTGRFGVPSSGVAAVLLNVTAAQPPAPGFVSLYPTPPRSGDVFNDQASFGGYPTTSNLNVRAGDVVSNMVLARVGAGGTIRLFNWAGPTHVIADLAGWFDTGGRLRTGDGFSGVQPTRVLDTRLGVGGIGGRFQAGEERSLLVAGVAGVPRDATSVVLNLTGVSPTSPGYLTLFPDGTARPVASNLNLLPELAARANLAVVRVGANGRIRIYADGTDVDVLADVLGSFGPGGGQVTAIDPTRVMDSRSGLGTPARPLEGQEQRTVQIAGRGGVPPWATAAIVNLTAVDGDRGGFLTMWPAGTTRPVASNLNFAPFGTTPNMAMVQLGAGGAIEVYNESGRVNVLVDVMGYVG